MEAPLSTPFSGGRQVRRGARPGGTVSLASRVPKGIAPLRAGGVRRKRRGPPGCPGGPSELLDSYSRRVLLHEHQVVRCVDRLPVREDDLVEVDAAREARCRRSSCRSTNFIRTVTLACSVRTAGRSLKIGPHPCPPARREADRGLRVEQVREVAVDLVDPQGTLSTLAHVAPSLARQPGRIDRTPRSGHEPAD
jgi:hypothetical protein